MCEAIGQENRNIPEGELGVKVRLVPPEMASVPDGQQATPRSEPKAPDPARLKGGLLT